jgi:hypothetical protein
MAAVLTGFLPHAHGAIMIGRRAALTLCSMASMKSRINAHIDLALGYLGLFLIGLVGWVCDRRGPRPSKTPRIIVRSTPGHPRQS